MPPFSRGPDRNELVTVIGVPLDPVMSENEIAAGLRQRRDGFDHRFMHAPNLGPDGFRQWRLTVGINQAENRVVDPMIVDDDCVDLPNQSAGDRQLAGPGKADQIDECVADRRV
jgi:hypothetical protein